MPTRQARWFGGSQAQLSYSFRIVGSRRTGFRDAYHALLKMPWWDAIGLIILAYLVLNIIFALTYTAIGGIANSGSFLDAFFFSVQTMGTIGYGSMAPESLPFNASFTSATAFSILALSSPEIFSALSFSNFSER